MNKTVSINLAGIFFHIDEDAYIKLQRYLEAIKRSFTDSQGRDEIISDIETRIAELFSEKIKDDRQVIGQKEVDDIITIMGQPEDYRLDEEIFEDEPQPKTTTSHARPKKLFRDTTSSYAGGVSSGLGHYLGIDAIWLRLAWILLTAASGGFFIILYVILWIIVPEAKTTADFLDMKGEAVNISNIEKKIKEGFDGVADKVKDVDYQKYTQRVKSGSTTFFEGLGAVLIGILKVFVKFIGILLLLFAGFTLIGLFIGLFVVGTFGFIDTPFTEYIEVVNHPNVPLWVISLFAFFAIGIPFFFLFVLGLKIVFDNLKSIGTPAKLSLLAVWLISMVGLIVIGVQQATQEAYDAEVTLKTEELPFNSQDTLYLKMNRTDRYIDHLYKRNDFKIKRNEAGEKVLVLQDVEIFIRQIDEGENATLAITSSADGSSYDNAKERASAIKYEYQINGNTIYFNGYALTDYKNKYNDQEIEIILSIPENMIIKADQNTSGYNNSWEYDDYVSIDGKEGEFIKLENKKFTCENCEEEDSDEGWKYRDYDDEDKDSIVIDINDEKTDTKLKIDENGFELKNEDVDIKINEDGVKIKTDN